MLLLKDVVVDILLLEVQLASLFRLASLLESFAVTYLQLE